MRGKIKNKILNIFFLFFLFLGSCFLFTQFVKAGTSTSTGNTTVSGDYPNTNPGCTGCVGGDSTAPSAIGDLFVSSTAPTSVTLKWTAPGDDGNSGTAAVYDLRYYTYSITSGNWDNATQVIGEPTPTVAGTIQGMTVDGLSTNTTYYFAIKTADEIGNLAGLSNVVSGFTSPFAVDTTSPIISNIGVLTLSANSVRISWNTDEMATSSVVYGSTTNYETGSLKDQTLATSHSFDLTALSPGVTYHFKVKSADASFNEAVSEDRTFSLGDSTPPEISNIQTTNISGTGARITWLTDEVSTSTVVYGLTDNYELGATSDNSFVTTHLINLSGLQSETAYHFKVKSADASFNEAESTDQVFTTRDISPPTISNIQISPQIISATITWDTSENADSQIAYGLTNSLGSLISDNNLVRTHSLTIGNLQSNTKYYFSVKSTDEGGNQVSSSILSFTTSRDAIAPANVNNLAAVAGNQQITLSWQNPGDSDFFGVMIRRGSNKYPATPAEGDLVFQGRVTSFIDSGLNNGTLYYYTVFAVDNSENFSSGAIASGIPTSGPPIQPPTGPIVGGGEDIPVYLKDFNFSVAQGKIVVPISQEISFLPGTSLNVKLSSQKLFQSAQQIVLSTNNSSYLLKFDLLKNQWETEITLPSTIGKYPVSLLITLADQRTKKIDWIANILPLGRIIETKSGKTVPVSGVSVSLLTSSALWPAGAYGQQNPQITNDNGEFGFLVPAGNYILQIAKEGYQTQDTGYFLSDGVVVNKQLEILAIPAKLKDVLDPDASVAQNIVNVAGNLGEKTAFLSKVASQKISATAKDAVKNAGDFVTNPIVKETTKDVVAPVVAGAAAVSATTAVGASQFILYLRFLFTQPILVLFRRKRRGWGVVYNSLTKIPLDLVTVRLVDAESKRVLQTKVTDKEGRFAFLPAPGRYLIEIKQNGFKFPTDFFLNFKEDHAFLDLYHGEIIEVKERGAIITPNIPLDPLGEELPVKKIIWQLILRRFQHTFALVSLILALAFVLITPALLTEILLGVQVVFYILFLRLAYPQRPKSWGIVYNENNKNPLERAVVRIFDTQYNKLLETQITDNKGRYSFLVGRNKYYMLFEKLGFEKKQSEPVDLQDHPEPSAVVAVDVGLQPKGGKEDINKGTS